MSGTSQGVQLRELDIVTIQHQLEGIECTVQTPLKIERKLKFMLVINCL